VPQPIRRKISNKLLSQALGDRKIFTGFKLKIFKNIQDQNKKLLNIAVDDLTKDIRNGTTLG
jgi:hypothetical protein